MATLPCISFLPRGYTITEIDAAEEHLRLSVQATTAAARCPKCLKTSRRRHSTYARTVQDTPIGSLTVLLQVKVRRFRCGNEDCERKTFAEQHPSLCNRRCRRTHRLIANLAQIGLALGGAAGARLAGKLAMGASASTLLRLLRTMKVTASGSPRIIGIDDWAFRKGRDYGTIIVDHEKRKPVDLLPSRESKDVTRWLAEHPTIEIVTRDRSGEYRDAIAEALPDAVQIADRWHLLKNLHEAVERHISRRYRKLRQLIVDAAQEDGNEVGSSIDAKRRRYAQGPAREAVHAARTAEREALYEAVKASYARGVYTTDIAQELNLSRATVSQWVNSDSLPPDTRGRFKRQCLIDDYERYLHRRLAEGCTNKSQLWREICAQGFSGSRTLVGKWIRQHYSSPKNSLAEAPPKQNAFAVPKPRALTWMLTRRDDELEAEEKQLVRFLLQDTKIRELRQLAQAFIHMLRNRLEDCWVVWLEQCCESGVKELRNFAIGLKRDEAAVRAAVQLPWSNGGTEGHVNRLKFLKRQTYGRAKFDLLRLRVLLAY